MGGRKGGRERERGRGREGKGEKQHPISSYRHGLHAVHLGDRTSYKHRRKWCLAVKHYHAAKITANIPIPAKC